MQLWSNDWELQYDQSCRKQLHSNPDEKNDMLVNTARYRKQSASGKETRGSEYLTIPLESGHYGRDKTKQTTGTQCDTDGCHTT